MDVAGEGPLSGIRVVELGTVLMVPYAARNLADLGADVIKIEGARLDSGRMMGPGPHEQLSGTALNLHRNKRSVQLDLTIPEAQAVMDALLRTADVFVTNLRPEALRRLNLDPARTCAKNPRLVYCESHGFRVGTDEENRATFDDVIQAETGLPSLHAAVTSIPQFAPAVVADKTVALFIVQAILAGLLERAGTGRGRRVEVPMFDAMLSFNLVEHLAGATVPGESPGYPRILSAHRGPHRTKDGYLAVMPYSDSDWKALYCAVGRQDELSMPQFQSQRSRHANPDVVYGSLADVLAERPTADWIALCEESGIPYGRVPSLDDLVEDRRLHRDMLESSEHPVAGSYRSIRSPIRFDNSAARLRRHAPVVGEHTTEVLAELGFDGETIDQLGRDGAVTRTRGE